jgi:hypothetical protein
MYKRLEQDAVNLEKLSSAWFEAHKHNALSAMLVLYLKEAQSGDLKILMPTSWMIHWNA